MSNQPDALDRTMQQTREWVHDIAGLMETGNQQTAYAALRGVLHTVRDRIPVEEAVDFSAQLPMLVRGIYFEGWHPADKPLTYRDPVDFLASVQRDAPNLEETNTEQAVRAVLTELSRKLDRGQVTQARECLPEEIRELWPEPA